jgi:hypothetical protein
MKTVESSAVFQPKQWAEKKPGRQSKTGPNPNLCPIRRQNRTFFEVPINENNNNKQSHRVAKTTHCHCCDPEKTDCRDSDQSKNEDHLATLVKKPRMPLALRFDSLLDSREGQTVVLYGSEKLTKTGQPYTQNKKQNGCQNEAIHF